LVGAQLRAGRPLPFQKFRIGPKVARSLLNQALDQRLIVELRKGRRTRYAKAG
jgi:hypothetical protein